MAAVNIHADGCDMCIDPDGLPCLPQWGSAPHKSFSLEQKGGLAVVHELTGEADDDFVPDADDPRTGTWYCSTKGCPNSKEIAGGKT